MTTLKKDITHYQGPITALVFGLIFPMIPRLLKMGVYVGILGGLFLMTVASRPSDGFFPIWVGIITGILAFLWFCYGAKKLAIQMMES